MYNQCPNDKKDCFGSKEELINLFETYKNDKKNINLDQKYFSKYCIVFFKYYNDRITGLLSDNRKPVNINGVIYHYEYIIGICDNVFGDNDNINIQFTKNTYGYEKLTLEKAYSNIDNIQKENITEFNKFDNPVKVDKYNFYVDRIEKNSFAFCRINYNINKYEFNDLISTNKIAFDNNNCLRIEDINYQHSITQITEFPVPVPVNRDSINLNTSFNKYITHDELSSWIITPSKYLIIEEASNFIKEKVSNFLKEKVSKNRWDKVKELHEDIDQQNIYLIRLFDLEQKYNIQHTTYKTITRFKDYIKSIIMKYINKKYLNSEIIKNLDEIQKYNIISKNLHFIIYKTDKKFSLFKNGIMNGFILDIPNNTEITLLRNFIDLTTNKDINEDNLTKSNIFDIKYIDTNKIKKNESIGNYQLVDCENRKEGNEYIQMDWNYLSEENKWFGRKDKNTNPIGGRITRNKRKSPSRYSKRKRN